MKEEIAKLLTAIGEDATREGLSRTPERVEKSLRYMTRGYGKTAREVAGDALFSENYDEMVIVKNIEVFSLCEHHILPFWGKAHVAYIPSGKVIGLSKIPRIIDVFACRLQVQERLTMQVSQAIQEILEPRGVGVVIEAQHLCMMMRGVEKQNSLAVTSSMLGAFRKSDRTRQEFLELIGHRRS